MMARVPDGYFCANCDKQVPEAEVKKVGQSIGNIHNVEGCRSGRVSPVWRETGDS